MAAVPVRDKDYAGDHDRTAAHEDERPNSPTHVATPSLKPSSL